MRVITSSQMALTISLVLVTVAGIPLCMARSTIMVKPGTDIQPLIDASPPGTTYLIQPGVHRLQSIQPRDGDIFEGAPGAILNGAQVVDHFHRDGSFWVRQVASARLVPLQPTRVLCLSGGLLCQYPQDLFLNNVLLRRVESVREMRSGTWYLDGARTIYIADDPTSRMVELSTAPSAFNSSSNAVVIRGLIVEKYANPAQQGAIHDTGKGWIIENNEVRVNHGVGLFLDSHASVRSNNVHHNGQLGIGGGGDRILLEDNQVAYNNTLDFDYLGTTGEAGGVKIVKSADLVVRHNFVHHNNGPGVWLDTDNLRWKVEGNRLSANREAGILIETSYSGTIRFNILEDEGYGIDPSKTSLWWRAGVMIQSSSDTEVYGNTLIRCGNGIGAISAERGSGPWGTYKATNTYVHDNSIIQTAGIAAGLVADVGTDHIRAYSSWKNRFSSNRYMLSAPAAAAFTWYQGGAAYRDIDLLQWQQTGQDSGSEALFTWAEVASIQKIASGDRIRVTNRSGAYSMPSRGATLIRRISPGDQGTITKVKGPIYYLREWWWDIRYDNDIQGWSPGSALRREL